MVKFFFVLVCINIVLYALGAGWFGFSPSELELGAQTRVPTEFRPQDIHFFPNK